ncbi:MAG: hypothetical protein J0L85_08920 [Zoogloea sp.]|nr:hypothetical protein [Zoogloea sp.]MCA0186588.1 hypothetical protein [Pseudomonadota bacterium]
MRILPLFTTASTISASVFALCFPFWQYSIPHTLKAAVSVFLLALPVLLVAAAQWRVRGRPHVSDFILVLIALDIWYYSTFFMAWFKPGLFGAAFFGCASAGLMLFIVWMVHTAIRTQAPPTQPP